MNIHIILVNQSLLKGLRLVMWSLLHDTDQLREMLSTDHLVSAKHFPRLDRITSLKPDYNMLPQSRPELLCYIAGNMH